MKHECPTCKTEFDGKKSRKFCSMKCRKSGEHPGRVAFNCPVCTKPFWKYRSAANGPWVKFCSPECKTRHYAERKTKPCSRCGKEVDADAGGSRCYCRECERLYGREYSRRGVGRFKAGKARAATKGFAWTLTETEFLALLDLPCHYCNRPLDPTGVGLDRKDSNGGYDTGNVVPCCGRCNKVKNEVFSYEQMLKLAQVIRLIDQETAQAA